MSLRLSPHRLSLRLGFYGLPTLAFAVAAYLRFFSDSFESLPPDRDPQFYLVILALATVIWAIAAERYRLCEIEELFREYTGVRKTFSACAVTYLSLVFVLFFYREHHLSRIFFGASAVLLLVFAMIGRMLFRMWFRRRFRLQRRIRVLVVGADSYALQTASRLRRVPFVPSEVVAHVRLSGQEVAVKNVPVFELGEIGNPLPIVFEDVIVALPPELLHNLSDIVRKLQVLGTPIRAILDLGNIAVIRERLFQFGDCQMLDISSTPAESPYYFVLKRAFDIVFSLTAIVVTGPLMLMFALLIKLTSRGPALFRQERVGLNGRRFTMYKLRTMRLSDKTDSDMRWTTADDDRRTKIGEFLRKTSLDELPQFFNVLRGDMSVVGPRPERPYFVSKFLREISHYNARHRLKVGITGWAQVNGWRGDTSITKRFEYDLYYLQNWSFWFDLQIVLMTLWSGFFGRNAY